MILISSSAPSDCSPFTGSHRAASWTSWLTQTPNDPTRRTCTSSKRGAGAIACIRGIVDGADNILHLSLISLSCSLIIFYLGSSSTASAPSGLLHLGPEVVPDDKPPIFVFGTSPAWDSAPSLPESPEKDQTPCALQEPLPQITPPDVGTLSNDGGMEGLRRGGRKGQSSETVEELSSKGKIEDGGVPVAVDQHDNPTAFHAYIRGLIVTVAKSVNAPAVHCMIP